MRLTVFTDYYRRSLMYFAAHQNKICMLRKISEFHYISYNHFMKVIYRLSQLGGSMIIPGACK